MDKDANRCMLMLGWKSRDSEEAVRDLLASLRHYCDLYGVDFGRADSLAHDQYLLELGEARHAQPI